MFNFVFITFPADGPAPLGPRTSGGVSLIFLLKFVYCRNRISYENSKLKLCMCAQSYALGTHAKFQLGILAINVISGIFARLFWRGHEMLVKQSPDFTGALMTEFVCPIYFQDQHSKGQRQLILKNSFNKSKIQFALQCLYTIQKKSWRKPACPTGSFYPRPVLAFGYCRCLRLSVCVSVRASITSLSARKLMTRFI